jgi:CHAT domain-containing protein/HEAT repeat protein
MLGATLLQLGRLLEAVTAYQQALRYDPESFSAEEGLAAAFRAGNDLEQSRAHYERAYSLNPAVADTAAELLSLLFDSAVATTANRDGALSDPDLILSATSFSEQTKSLAWSLAKSRSRNARGIALFCLGGMMSTATEPLLLEALEDPVSRAQAVRGLRSSLPRAEVPRLLRDKDPATRLAVLQVVDQDTAEAFLPAIYQLAGDREPAVRAAAVEDLMGLKSMSGKVKAPWIGALGLDAKLAALARDPTPVVRQSACGRGRWAPPFNAPLSTEHLHQCIEDPDAAVRIAALRVIKDTMQPSFGLPAAETVDWLLPPTLSDPDDRIRQAGAEVLGSRAAQVRLNSLIARRAAAALEAALGRDPAPNVRAYAAWALEQLRLPRSAGPLVAALGDQDPQVQTAAARALATIGDWRVASDLLSRLPAARGPLRESILLALGKSGAAEAEPPLLAALKSEQPRERHAACQALATLALPSSLESLREAAGDPVAPVRAIAVAALGRFRSSGATTTIRQALGDPDAAVRRAAAWAAAEARDVASIARLAALSADPVEEVRVASIYALATLSGRTAPPELISCFTSDLVDVRLNALQAAALIGDPAAEEGAVGRLTDPVPAIRTAAAEALSRVGTADAIPSLRIALRNGDSPLKIAAAETLRRLGAVEAVPDLITAAQSDSDDTPSDLRRAVLDALATMNTEAARGFITSSLQVSKLRKDVLWSLRDLDRPEIMSAVVASLERPKERSTAREALRRWARLSPGKVPPSLITSLDVETRLSVLGSPGMAALHPALNREAIVLQQERVSSPDPVQASAAVNWLARLPGPEGTAALLTALRDPRAEVHGPAAIWLLSRETQLSEDQLKGLGSGTAEERLFAKIQAARRGDNTALVDLIASIGELDDYARFEVLRLAMKQHRAEVVPLLLESLAIGSNDAAAVVALGELRAREAIPSLLHVLHVLASGDEAMAAPFAATALLKIDLQATKGQVLRYLDRICRATAVLQPPAQKPLEHDPFVYMYRGQTSRSFNTSGLCTAIAEPLADFAAGLPPGDAGREDITRALYSLLFDLESAGLYSLLQEHHLYPAAWDAVQPPQPSFARAAALSLRAVDARNRLDREEERRRAHEAESLAASLGESGLRLVAMSLRAHAELSSESSTVPPAELISSSFGAAREAMSNATAQLRRLSGRDGDLDELIPGETLYWQARATAADGQTESLQAAMALLDQLRSDLSWRRPQFDSWDVAGKVDRLDGLALAALGFVHGALRSNYLPEAETKLGNGPIGDAVVFQEQEKVLWAQARGALSVIPRSEEDVRTALRYFEKIQLLRRQFLNRESTIRLGDPKKQELLDELRLKAAAVESAEHAALAPRGKGDAQLFAGPSPDEASAAADQRLQEQRQQLVRFIELLKRDHPELAALARAEPIELRALQDQLSPEVALLQYILLPTELIVFVVRSDSVEVLTGNVGQEQLTTKVKEYLRHYLAFLRRVGAHTEEQDLLLRALSPVLDTGSFDDGAFHTLAEELYTMLVAPAERGGLLTGVRTLAIAGNGILHYLPFAALIRSAAGPEYVVDKYSVVYVHGPSLLWAALKQNQPSAAREFDFLALGNPDRTLASAEAEVHAIGELFAKARTKVVVNDGATRQLLRDDARRSTIIHLATHAAFDEDDVRRSQLKLADGTLSLDDVWALPLTGVKLVTLSACQTGVGKIQSGDDLVSLESAFVYAGSSSVMATLWPVVDDSTKELMVEFYRSLGKGLDKAAALAAAQQALKAIPRWQHPAYWAGFTIRGAWK